MRLSARFGGMLALGCAASCGVEVSRPARVPYVEAYEVARFADLEQDYGRTLLLADCDGDGVDELFVGAPSLDPAYDGIVLVVSLQSLEVVDLLAPWRALGESSSHHDEFGSAIVTADWNGDGRLDVAVGDPNGDAAGTERAGETWVFLAPLDTTLPLRLRAETPATGGRFGAALAAGDFDGDGATDLAVGAPHPAGSGLGAPQVAICFGPDLDRRETRGAADGGGRFGEMLVAVPEPDGAALVVGAPEAANVMGSSGDAFAWRSAADPDAPLRLATPARPDQGFGCAGTLGDFDGDGDSDLALLAPRGRGGLYLFDSARWRERATIAMPDALGKRRGAPIVPFADVTGDRADELVLLSADRDEQAGVLFSPGRGSPTLPAHVRLDFPAAAGVVGNFDFDDDPELLLATPSSFEPHGGLSKLTIVDFDWLPIEALRARSPVVIPGIAALRERFAKN